MTKHTRRAGWGLRALAALAALVGLALALAGALAEHPSGLRLVLSVEDNAANIAPQGSTIKINGEFRYTGNYVELDLTAGALRVAGNLEWEAATTARTRLDLPAQRSGIDGALTGFAVAVEDRTTADGGDIVVVGAPKDIVDDHEQAGSVDVFVNGTFVTRLTAGGDAANGAQFGYSVDVAGGVIVVGAPFEGGGGPLDWENDDNADTTANSDERPQGAVYVFAYTTVETVADWRQIAKLTPVNFPNEDVDHDSDPATPAQSTFYQTRPIAKFGQSVAIDDAGDNIVVGHEPGVVDGMTTGDQARWESLGQVFTKPSGGWADQTIVKAGMEPEVAYLQKPADAAAAVVGLGQGELDISGDGAVIAVGVPDRDVDTTPSDSSSAKVFNHGGVLIYSKPSASQTDDWDDANADTKVGRVAAPVALDVSGHGTGGTAFDTDHCLQLGESVALSSDGAFLVAGAPGAYATPCGGDRSTLAMNTLNGAVMVFARSGATWAAATAATAVLAEPISTPAVPATDGEDGERFGQSVAINDDGSRILVGNAADRTAVNNVSHAKGYAHVYNRPHDGMNYTAWLSRSTLPDATLSSPQTETRLAFGSGVALDGATAATTVAVVGQAEALEHLELLSGGENFVTGHGRAYSFDLSNATASEWQGTAARRGVLTMPCESSGSGGNANWICDLTGVDTRVVITPGTANGTRITFSRTGLTVNGHGNDNIGGGNLVVTVGQIATVDSTEFVVASGGSTSVETLANVDLVLKLRAAGRPATPQVIGSVLITATRGQLSSPAGATGACSGASCQLDISKLHSTGHGVIITDNIPLRWTAPNTPGGVAFNVIVNPAAGAGGQGQVQRNSLSITVTGTASSLQISAPARPLYYQPTDGDDNDVARFEIKAVDSDDRSVVPPDQIRSWDVKRGSLSVKDQFTLTRDPTSGRTRGQAHLVLTVTGNDLAPGAYVLETTMGRRATGTRSFNVVGAPANVRITDEGQRTFGGRLTYEARVSDSNGNAVVDGTVVTFTNTRVGNATLAPSGDRTATTSGGRASTTFIVVGTGTAVVVASAGEGSSVIRAVSRFSVGGFIGGGGGSGGGGTAPPPVVVAPPPVTVTPPPVQVQEPEPPPPPASFLSAQTADAQVTWDGTGSVTAEQLLDDLNGIAAIYLWNGTRWLPYGRVNGREIPGSVNFIVFAGNTLWLTGPPG